MQEDSSSHSDPQQFHSIPSGIASVTLAIETFLLRFPPKSLKYGGSPLDELQMAGDKSLFTVTTRRSSTLNSLKVYAMLGIINYTGPGIQSG